MSLLLSLQSPASPDATGTLAFTTSGIGFAGSGSETIIGTASATLGSITFAGAGLETETGALAFATSGITFSGAGLETETGQLAFTTDSIVFSGTGNVATADTAGILAFTTDSIVFAGQGVETESGQLAFTTDSIGFAGTGLETETGSLAFTTGDIAFAGSGLETITGQLDSTLDSILFSGLGNIVTSDVNGILSITLAGIEFSSNGEVLLTGKVVNYALRDQQKRDERRLSAKKKQIAYELAERRLNVSTDDVSTDGRMVDSVDAIVGNIKERSATNGILGYGTDGVSDVRGLSELAGTGLAAGDTESLGIDEAMKRRNDEAFFLILASL